MDPQDLLKSIVAPALVAGAILLVFWGLASGAARRDASAPASVAAIAVSVATLVGFGLLFQWNLWPRESWRWILWVFPAAAIFGTLESRKEITASVRWLLRVVLVVTAVALVLHKALLSAGHLDLAKAALYLGSPLVVIGLWQALLPRLGAVPCAVALWMMVAGTAAMFALAGILNFAHLGAALAAALGALIVAGWLRPSPSGIAGAITPAAVILSMLVFLCFELSFAPFPRWLFALVALAPLLGALPFARKTSSRLALIAIPIAVGVGWAFSTFDASAL